MHFGTAEAFAVRKIIIFNFLDKKKMLEKLDKPACWQMEEASACSSLISALLLPPFDSAEKIVENTFFAFWC